MTSQDHDPWTRWYDAYLGHRSAIKAAKLLAQERRRVANRVAGWLLAYMVVGGLAAGVAVGLVMAN